MVRVSVKVPSSGNVGITAQRVAPFNTLFIQEGANTTSNVVGNIIVSDVDPTDSDGNNGDIWIKY